MESSTSLSQKCLKVFELTNSEYHRYDSVDYPAGNPFDNHSFEHLLFKKNWIDNVQWHLEDEIRNPNIHADMALRLKRRIDVSNQERTDIVEAIDTYFDWKYQSVVPSGDAYCNTESPAWALDRLSILVLRIS